MWCRDMNNKLLTLEDLLSHQACEHDLKLFTDTFGKELPLTIEMGTQAVTAGLNIDWYVLNIITPSQRREYRREFAPISHEYHRKLAELSAINDIENIKLLHHQLNISKVELLARILDKE